VPLVFQETVVIQVLKVSKVSKDYRAPQVFKELKEYKATQVFKVLKEYKVILVSKEPLDKKEYLEKEPLL
jgi:hypothetical protein